MSTSTTNYELIKPDYGDTADIGDINDNMDIIDGRLFGLTGSFCSIQEGDTATSAIAEGQYVMWKGVLTKASTAIANGDALNSTKLPAVKLANNLRTVENRFSSGILKIANGGTGMSAVQATDVTQNTKGMVLNLRKFGPVVSFRMSGTLTSSYSSGSTLLTFPSGYRPVNWIRVPVFRGSTDNTNVYQANINTSGVMSIWGDFDSGTSLFTSGAFIV